MAKLTLTDITSGHGSADLHNANNTLLEAALENTLSRDGTTPNTMSADLDMNGNNILNVGATATAQSWNFRGVWTTATAYAAADVVYVQLSDDATNGGRTYYCNTAHTSGTFATDLGNSLWQIVAQRGATGATGAGTGDLLAANNLSDLGNLTTSLNNLITAHGALATADIADDAITLAKMAAGTDGNLITYDASGDPAYVATGTATQVLTSNGAGAAPTFQAPASATAAASQAEMEAGTSTTTYASPGRMQNHPGVAKAWGNIAANGTINASYNVASVVVSGTTSTYIYDVTLTNAMASANYAILVTMEGGTNNTVSVTGTPTSSTFNYKIEDNSSNNVKVGNSFVIYGDQ
jgi:hypothetical protein